MIALKNKTIIAVWILITSLMFSCKSGTSDRPDESPLEGRAFMLARADSLELDTPYDPPPGDTLSLHAAGFAKILCSAVFITGLDFEFAAENIGYFSAPYEIRPYLTDRILDLDNKSVHITLPNGVVRTAVYVGDQGCICLEEGKDKPAFDPVDIPVSLPDPATQPWPMGDVINNAESPPGVDMDLVNKAIDTAFSNPQAMTAAYVVTYKNQIIGERYRKGLDRNAPLESWSMGKSLTATLMGILIGQGIYQLDQPAPIPEWQEQQNDPRAEITIADLLHMSSGLRFRAPLDPDFDRSLGYPDHIYVYTSTKNTFKWTAQRVQQWPPNTVGRYRNCDPVLVNYLIRLGVEEQGKTYLTFPQLELFDKIGIRHMVLETDPYGNLLLQGYDFGTARDWARLGNLYLNDGIWMGERILPEGFVDFVSTLAPAWVADGRPIYGGFFWINGMGEFPIPKDAYFMAGAGGQYVIIIPSHDLVVVKMSHYKGGSIGATDLNASLSMILQAVPSSD